MFKSLLTLLFCFGLSFALMGQSGTIKGHVVDSKNLAPLSFASVYINNTTMGTRTDAEGNFLLTRLPFGENELVISYVGYQPYQTKVMLPDSAVVTLTAKLIPSPVNLTVVQIQSKRDNQWNLQLEKFKKLFFGNSPYTANCKIFNPWVLNFTESEDGVLNATVTAPLDIENVGLGYRITYQMKKFSVGPSFYNIDGNVRFQELETVDSVLIKLWQKRRAETYRGSYRQLFKAIIDQKVDDIGFRLFEDQSGIGDVVRKSNFLTNLNGAIIPYATSDKVLPGTRRNLYRIKLPSRIEVHYLNRAAPAIIYRNVPNPVSWIEVAGGSLDVNTAGIVLNPSRMVVSGAMSEARFAQILPYDYVPPNDAPFKKARPLSTLASLVEQPYLQTDKPYYYANDIVFFKAYMNYVTPVLGDSLSRALHVELVDLSNKVWVGKIFPIVGGSVIGSFDLPASLATGDYVLQAYTRWMLNFDKHFIFARPIKVLANNQLVRIPVDYKPDTAGRVNLSTDREEYLTIQKITVGISVRDFFGFPLASTVSVSVTDIEQASPVGRERNILNGFPIDETYLPDTTMGHPVHPIQLGIDFNGRFITKRKKPLPGVLTIFQENIEDVFAIPTDAKGVFRFHLPVIDSSGLLVMAKTLKGRGGTVVLDPEPVLSPSVSGVGALAAEVYTPSTALSYSLGHLPGEKSLQEVTVQGNKFQDAKADTKYLQSDFKIDGEWLRENYQTDLLSAIQSRVPGLRVLYFNGNGSVRKFLVFGVGSSLAGTQECLVEVDGVVLVDDQDQSVADQLASMSASQIESIDVIKYGGLASYGARGANGVIIIKTTKGNFKAPRKRTYNRKNLQVVKLKGYSTAAQFDSPDYSDSTRHDSTLDTRSTIYWNPQVSTDATATTYLSFFSASLPTRYRIVVEGIDSKGDPVRGEKIVAVKER